MADMQATLAREIDEMALETHAERLDMARHIVAMQSKLTGDEAEAEAEALVAFHEQHGEWHNADDSEATELDAYFAHFANIGPMLKEVESEVQRRLDNETALECLCQVGFIH